MKKWLVPIRIVTKAQEKHTDVHSTCWPVLTFKNNYKNLSIANNTEQSGKVAERRKASWDFSMQQNVFENFNMRDALDYVDYLSVRPIGIDSNKAYAIRRCKYIPNRHTVESSPYVSRHSSCAIGYESHARYIAQITQIRNILLFWQSVQLSHTFILIDITDELQIHRFEHSYHRISYPVERISILE